MKEDCLHEYLRPFQRRGPAGGCQCVGLSDYRDLRLAVWFIREKREVGKKRTIITRLRRKIQVHIHLCYVYTLVQLLVFFGVIVGLLLSGEFYQMYPQGVVR